MEGTVIIGTVAPSKERSFLPVLSRHRMHWRSLCFRQLTSPPRPLQIWRCHPGIRHHPNLSDRHNLRKCFPEVHCGCPPWRHLACSRNRWPLRAQRAHHFSSDGLRSCSP
jgi:hypothetical protein